MNVASAEEAAAEALGRGGGGATTVTPGLGSTWAVGGGGAGAGGGSAAASRLFSGSPRARKSAPPATREATAIATKVVLWFNSLQTAAAD
jgi:hypothetical protein